MFQFLKQISSTKLSQKTKTKQRKTLQRFIDFSQNIINHPKTKWKTLNWIIVPILASMSYFFIKEAWNNYTFGRTNLSIDEIPIQGQPTTIICMGNPKQSDRRVPLAHLDVNLYYYRKDQDQEESSTKWKRLKEGPNHIQDEIIVLRKMKFCHAIIAKKANDDETYQHKLMEKRYIRAIFPPGDALYRQGQTYADLFHDMSLYFYFTSEDKAYPIDFGRFQLSAEEAYVVKLRQVPSKSLIEVMAYINLKPTITKYIKEKSGCRDVSVLKLIAPNFIALAKDSCDQKACTPRGFPEATELR